MITAETFEGKPCPHGHTTRYTKSKQCVACLRAKKKEFRARNREKAVQHQRDYVARKSSSQEWPLTRREALQEGVEYYYTGKPCANGHISKRHAIHKYCVECYLSKLAAIQAANASDIAASLASGARTPKEADIAGVKFYRGKPCKYGHDGLRYTSTTECVECAKVRQQQRYQRELAARSGWSLGGMGEIRDDVGVLIARKRAECGQCKTPSSCRWCPALLMGR